MNRTLFKLAWLFLAVVATNAVVTARADQLPLPLTDADFYTQGPRDADKVELGRMLFFDKVLSGNRNISCATCHHPTHASGDGVALPLGEGPRGLGPLRRPGKRPSEAVTGRVPRNSPALFNLGTHEYEKMFHDGRVETDPDGYYAGGFITPAKWKLPTGLDNVLAAQAMFPVTSPVEMAGDKGENPVADAASLNNAAGPGGVWKQLAGRLQRIPGYVELFERAYPAQVSAREDISFVLAANAIAAFETSAFRADNSAFDRYLRGESGILTQAAERGMRLFYGEAGCSGCHAGKLQTDHEFHAIAMPQIGPGKGHGTDSSYWRATGWNAQLEDFGRGRVTYREADNFKFRTPSLRNVALTGPWGHAGAYDSLEDTVRHHLDPTAALEAYVASADQLLPLGVVREVAAIDSLLSQNWLRPNRMRGFAARDTWVQENADLRNRIGAANELPRTGLTDTQIEDLLAFLDALTDPASTQLGDLVPARVPSGLPVND